jgi:phenylacetaldehyde dehydrogenase
MDAATAQAQLGNAAKSFLAGKHQLLIDGKSVEAKSGKKFDVFDPATGQAIAAVAEADAADVDEAVKAARRAFETGPWSKTSPADRCKLMWKLADLLESHADEIAQLESLDNGKPIRDARNVDLPGSYEILRYMAGWATKINGSTITVSSPGLACLYPARAGRRGRSDHPVELSADDGGVEDRARTGRRLHDRPEAS